MLSLSDSCAVDLFGQQRCIKGQLRDALERQKWSYENDLNRILDGRSTLRPYENTFIGY